MKAIRRSPITRVTSWLLTTALIAPMALVGHTAGAQDQQVMKIVISDTDNRAPGASQSLGINTTAALYNEFAASGLGKFNVVSPTEIRNEDFTAQRFQNTVCVVLVLINTNEWLRLAKSLAINEQSQVTAVKLEVAKSGGREGLDDCRVRMLGGRHF